MQKLSPVPPVVRPQWPPVDGGSALRPPKQPQLADFWLRAGGGMYFVP